jgi:hypothetical protein
MAAITSLPSAPASAEPHRLVDRVARRLCLPAQRAPGAWPIRARANDPAAATQRSGMGVPARAFQFPFALPKPFPPPGFSPPRQRPGECVGPPTPAAHAPIGNWQSAINNDKNAPNRSPQECRRLVGFARGKSAMSTHGTQPPRTAGRRPKASHRPALRFRSLPAKRANAVPIANRKSPIGNDQGLFDSKRFSHLFIPIHT